MLFRSNKRGSLPDSFNGENTSSMNSEGNSGKEINRMMNDVEIQDVENRPSKPTNDIKNLYDGLPPMHPSVKSTHNNLNPALKKQLKLDLTAVRQKTHTNDSKAPSIDANGSNPAHEDQGLGFHDEFMARLDEFSLSWRQAAMQEKKH